MKKELIIFTDIGDTIIDEGSQVFDKDGETVLSASCIPGAVETYTKLYEQGYQIVMVADGKVQSFKNTMSQNKLDCIFSAKVISEEVGETKPSQKMFMTAFEKMNLTEKDKGRVIMIGNNVERDITGANLFGIKSVLIKWSPRYKYETKAENCKPSYTISKPEELLDLIAQLS